MNGSNIAAIIITIVLVLCVVAFFIYCFADQKQLQRCYKCFKKSLPFSRFEDEEETSDRHVRFQNDQISGNVFDEDQQNTASETQVNGVSLRLPSSTGEDVEHHIRPPNSTSNGASPIEVLS